MFNLDTDRPTFKARRGGRRHGLWPLARLHRLTLDDRTRGTLRRLVRALAA